ncbi:MAG TPA: glycoside hydrolase family 38 C-terminal domain-containing protein [Bacteroidales bacterium]
MKQYFMAVLIILTNCVYSEIPQTNNFPDNIEYKVQPFYRHRPDGKPGREVILRFKGAKLFATSKLEIIFNNIHETIQLESGIKGADSIVVLLPPDIGVKQASEVQLILKQGAKKLSKTISVPAMRYWTVYVYPHSHVDIGYSNTQENVEFIHKRNIDQGIKLAEKTKDYPEGASYLWNTEVMWPLERYMHTAANGQKNYLIDAVKRGELCLDAAYVHVNTSTCSEEEMFQLFKYSRDIEKQTGKPIDVMVQVDVPGMAWGIVPVLAHEGIRYIMMMPNGTRGNQKMTYALNQKPFWWVGQDGKSKVLFLQPGSYGVGLEKGRTTGRPWFGQQDTAKIPKVIKTDNPRANFLDNHLFSTLPSLELSHHPYDIYVVTWAMWDNALLDADLPDAVKSWNNDYAYPHLVIASAHEIMQTFEKRYGDQLPIVKGDYTEYWTDNMGVAAKETRMNSNAKERLLQAETVWTMLHPGKPAPSKDFDEAWRNIILGSEHTFASENSMDPFFFNAVWKVKQSYFREAEDRSMTLLDNALAPATDRSSGALGPVEGPSNGGVAVLNTHSWNHGGLVSLTWIESQRGDRVIDDHGKEVLSQRLSTGELVFLASDVPAFGSRHYRVVPGKCSLTGTCKFSNNIIENGLLQVELDKKSGNIVRLEETASGQNFAESKVNKGLNTFIWQPGKNAGNAKPDTNIVISLSESGPLVIEVQVSSQATGCRSVVRKIRLINGQPWVEFSNTVDKLPLVAKDGIHFGYSFNVPEGKTHVDIPWNVMRLEEDQWPAGNRAWMVTQHWVDISNNKQGVTWCSLDAPLFESGSITANNTAGWDGAGDVWPSKLSPSSTIYSWVMNNHWYTNTPLTQDGPVTFRYRVLPHNEYDAVTANRFGLEQAQPLVHVLCDKNPIENSFVSIDNNRVFVNLLKSMADGKSMILRLRSFSDKDELAKLTWFARKPASVFLCDREEEAGKMEVSSGVTVPAMGFVTLRAEW